jgi:hypothetical protein
MQGELQQLKGRLLNVTGIIDNSFLDDYVVLIVNNANTAKEKFVTNVHHIIPRCYFKLRNEPVDNTKDNLVNLTYADHIKAHYLLCKCTTGLFAQKCYGAFRYLFYKYRDIGNVLLTDLDLEFLQERYSQFRKHLSETLKGRAPWNKGGKGIKTKGCSGQHWYNNGITSTLAFECPEGFVKGRLMHENSMQKPTAETRRKMSAAKKNKCFGAANNNARKVSMFTREGEYLRTFSTVKEAEAFIGVVGVRPNLWESNKTCGGYRWKYE